MGYNNNIEISKDRIKRDRQELIDEFKRNDKRGSFCYFNLIRGPSHSLPIKNVGAYLQINFHCR